MDIVNIKCPVTVGNFGILMKYVDKSTLFKCVRAYLDEVYSEKANDGNLVLDISNPYGIVSVDVIEEKAEIALASEYYHAMIESAILPVVSLSFICDMSPEIETPMWKINAVKSHLLTVNVQANIEDFITTGGVVDSHECGCDGSCEECKCKEEEE